MVMALMTENAISMPFQLGAGHHTAKYKNST
jgi:hypothetical protein